MVGVSDPVEAGLVASLARPGGNVTGTSTVIAATVGKQLALLREILPSVRRVGVMWNPSNPVFQRSQLAAATAAGRDLEVQIELFEVSALARVDEAFQRMQQRAIEGLLVLADPLYVSRPKSIFDLALKHRIPAVSGARVMAEAGALATYGPAFSEGHRRAAVYIDRILKGARPENLPIAQNTAFDVVVNTATAEALGIRLPPPLLLRAETVR
jgi:putative ABC transport system substrate-binding protein